MKKIISVSVFFALVLSAFAQTGEYRLTKSNVRIAGTSTLHDWTADVQKTSGNITADVGGGSLSAIRSVWLDMDVNSIKSEKGGMMDKNIRNTLKAKDYPKITFQLSKISSMKGNDIVANGTLTVAGTGKNVDLNVKGKVLPSGELEFTGSKKMKMTDFKVEPPVFMMGTLKTGDDITITFSVTFSK